VTVHKKDDVLFTAYPRSYLFSALLLWIFFDNFACIQVNTTSAGVQCSPVSATVNSAGLVSTAVLRLAELLQAARQLTKFGKPSQPPDSADALPINRHPLVGLVSMSGDMLKLL